MCVICAFLFVVGCVYSQTATTLARTFHCEFQGFELCGIVIPEVALQYVVCEGREHSLLQTPAETNDIEVPKLEGKVFRSKSADCDASVPHSYCTVLHNHAEALTPSLFYSMAPDRRCTYLCQALLVVVLRWLQHAINT